MATDPPIPDEAVRLAAEAIEDVAIRRLGRDLGTVHRDDIVRAGLAAAYPLLAEQIRHEAYQAGLRAANNAINWDTSCVGCADLLETAVRDLPEHLRGDGPCSDCGTLNNVVWFAESVFWNAVCRQGDYVEPILCVPCFVRRTDAAGFYITGWRLLPDFHWETRDERAARVARGESGERANAG